MPSQQAADKNGIQISSKTHTRVQELLRRGTMSASKAGMESPAILLIYDPKHIRKSKLVKLVKDHYHEHIKSVYVYV